MPDYSAPSRTLSVRATMTLLTGHVFSLTADEILSYSLSEGASGGDMLLGSALAEVEITIVDNEGILPVEEIYEVVEESADAPTSGDLTPEEEAMLIRRLNSMESTLKQLNSFEDSWIFEGMDEDGLSGMDDMGDMASLLDMMGNGKMMF